MLSSSFLSGFGVLRGTLDNAAARPSLVDQASKHNMSCNRKSAFVLLAFWFGESASPDVDAASAAVVHTPVSAGEWWQSSFVGLGPSGSSHIEMRGSAAPGCV